MEDSNTFANDFMNDLEIDKFDDKGLFEPVQEGKCLTEEAVKKHANDYIYLSNSELYDYIVNMEQNKVRYKKKY